MTDGICPFAVWRPVGSFGYPKGIHNQNRPLVFVDHIMGGWKSTMDRPGWQESANISAHFGEGLDGSLSQYVNILDASWANGLVGQSPRGDRRGIDLYNRDNSLLAQIENEAHANWHTVELDSGPKWTMSIGNANAWNIRSVTTEHEGVNQNAPWTPAMVEIDIEVKEWTNKEFRGLQLPIIPYDRNGIIGHNNIDHIDRAYCPGPGRPLDEIIRRLNATGEEVFVRHNRVSSWYAQPVHQKFKTTAGVNATLDFGLPDHITDIEVEVYVNDDSADVKVMDADEKHPGGQAFQVERPLRMYSGRVKLMQLDDGGWFHLASTAGNIRAVGCVGYYE